MSSKKKRPGRTLILFLVLVLAMGLTLAIGTFMKKTTGTPNLALDLEGGTQLILTPKTIPGKSSNKSVTAQDINQAIEVIRQRVDASGVSEAEITSQGESNIVVSLPGSPSESTLDLVRKSAELNFRAVLMSGPGISKLQEAQLIAKQQNNNGKSTDGKQAAPQVAAPNTDNPVEYAKQEAKKYLEQHPVNGTPKNNSDLNQLTEEVMIQYYAKDCTSKKAREGGDSGDPKKVLIACSLDGNQKYILSPVELAGTHIVSAASGMGSTPGGQSNGQWVVNLKFDSVGAKTFAEVSKRLFAFRNQPNPNGAAVNPANMGGHNDLNRFAIVLDGNVVSAPGIESPIQDGSAQISGSFTKSSATTLANQLQFGALPLNFEVQSEQQVSATLGSDQLQYGIWAGILGLILVTVYLIWQYRGLAIIAVGSLVSAGVILYLVLALLSWAMGYRLSLAGVAGVVISIGMIADSFIIYFERIRDEVRDGRPLREAIEEGWERAKRTILTSKTVNILAATVLYFLAVGGVQGFAFTLGVTTAIDLFIIFVFTHPMMSSLVRVPFFGKGHKLSGLDPEHLGAQINTYRYSGAGKIRKVKSLYRKPENTEADATDVKSDEGEEK